LLVDSHAGDTGSSPVGTTTNKFKDLRHFLSPFFMPYFSRPQHYPHH